MKSRIKTAVVHGFVGRGGSVREAKGDAARQIEGLQEGGWLPRLVHWRGLVGVVFRELSGWSYFILRPGDTREFPSTCMLADGEFRSVLNACRRHIAQNAWVVEDGANLPAVLCDNPMQDRTEFITWARWQVAVSEGKNRGMNDEEARSYANSVA